MLPSVCGNVCHMTSLKRPLHLRIQFVSILFVFFFLPSLKHAMINSNHNSQNKLPNYFDNLVYDAVMYGFGRLPYAEAALSFLLGVALLLWLGLVYVYNPLDRDAIHTVIENISQPTSTYDLLVVKFGMCGKWAFLFAVGALKSAFILSPDATLNIALATCVIIILYFIRKYYQRTPVISYTLFLFWCFFVFVFVFVFLFLFFFTILNSTKQGKKRWL